MNATKSKDGKLRSWICQSVKALVAASLLAATAGKVATPEATGTLVSARMQAVYGVIPGWGAALVAILVADMVLLMLLLTRQGRGGADLGVVAFGLAFLLHHLLDLRSGGGECGCFGAGIEVPPIVAALISMLLVLYGSFRLAAGGPASALSGHAVALALAWLAVPIAAGAAFGGPLEAALRPLSDAADESDVIRSRNVDLFVFSPSCPSCITVARRLAAAAESGRLVGITTRSHGTVADFFKKVGFTFPIEYVTPARWFGLIDSEPPAYYQVDAAGRLTRSHPPDSGGH